VLSSNLGLLLRLTMRSNAGRRTRLRAPRQQEYEAQSWRKRCHSRCNAALTSCKAPRETRKLYARVPILGRQGRRIGGATLTAEDTVDGWRGTVEARRVIVEPVNLNHLTAPHAHHSQGPQQATVARMRSVHPSPAIKTTKP
jgi:hypothetical protein